MAITIKTNREASLFHINNLTSKDLEAIQFSLRAAGHNDIDTKIREALDARFPASTDDGPMTHCC